MRDELLQAARAPGTTRGWKEFKEFGDSFPLEPFLVQLDTDVAECRWNLGRTKLERDPLWWRR
jgi:hypothetical protein